MKIKDLLKLDIDVDVYDNVEDGIEIAFCGPMELTPDGQKRFAEVLDYDIELDIGEGICIVYTDKQDGKIIDNYEPRLRDAEFFFHALAGYCSAEDYYNWFFENKNK